MSSKLENFVSG
ncbi:hypothetical protein F383_27062 [Gossypium arboreum]|uniref:Uncharacterized protein n=1 Tax=Gossypium arboreum TaxID=29729 RepID=A0A0B0P973_GOSAR|nr:hypothetical protein F383_27062 [Gossypium arboreum]